MYYNTLLFFLYYPQSLANFLKLKEDLFAIFHTEKERVCLQFIDLNHGRDKNHFENK